MHDISTPPGGCQFFPTCSGVKLSFRLPPLTAAEVDNRNTCFKGWFEGERLLGFDKIDYGEIQLAHRCAFLPDGGLAQAEITDIDGDVTEMAFDTAGQPVRGTRHEDIHPLPGQDRREGKTGE